MNFKVCTNSSLRFGEVTLRRNSKSFNTPLLLHLFPNFSKEVLELSGFDVSNLAILVPIAEVFKLQEAADKMKVEISRIIGFDGVFSSVFCFTILINMHIFFRLLHLHESEESSEILSIADISREGFHADLLQVWTS